MAGAQNEATGRTKACLKAIKETPQRSPAVVVLGKAGAGKSSLVECITGATGLSGNFTSPGSVLISAYLESGNYMVDNSVTRNVGFDLKLVAWLAAFCGCQGVPLVQPRIIQELEDGTSFENISSAKVLRPPTQKPEPPPAEEANTSANTDAGLPEESNWLRNGINWFFRTFTLEVNTGMSGLNGGIGLGGARANFDLPYQRWKSSYPSRDTHRPNGSWSPDPNSVVEAFRSRGMDSSLAGRTARGEPRSTVPSSLLIGSAARNIATRRALERIHPF